MGVSPSDNTGHGPTIAVPGCLLGLFRVILCRTCAWQRAASTNMLISPVNTDVMVGLWPVFQEGKTPTLDTYLIYSYLMSI